MDCPACNDKEAVKLGVRHKEFELYRCPVCDLMFWYPMKAPGRDYYQAWTVDFSGIKPIWSPHTAYKKFFRDMPGRGGRLLDIGCGTGEFCYLAQRAGYSVTGIDFAPRFIEAAHRRFPSLDLEPLTLDEFIAKRPADKYDVVTFIQVLEHLDNVRDFLQSVKIVLKPGGYAICGVPNRERWRFLPRLVPEEGEYPPNHFTWWNSACLARLFDSSGFSVLSIEFDPMTPFDCSFLISERLRINKIAEWLGKKLVSRNAPQPGVSLPGSEVRTGVKTYIAKLGYRLYYRALLPSFGIITLPLLPLLRKSGYSIYLLARLRDASSTSAT